jgi:hypothetical protein
MKEIIIDNQSLLDKMTENDLKNFLEVGKKLSSVDDFADHSISIGFVSKFRELLFSAIANVFESKFPVLPAMTKLFDNKQTNESLSALKNRLGLIDNEDIGLKTCLNVLTFDTKKYCWTQLPYMYGYIIWKLSFDPMSHIIGSLEGNYS